MESAFVVFVFMVSRITIVHLIANHWDRLILHLSALTLLNICCISLSNVGCPWNFSHQYSHCLSLVYLAISTRDCFTEDNLVIWLLKSSSLLFPDVPQTINTEAVVQMYPLGLGSHDLLISTLCPVIVCCDSLLYGEAYLMGGSSYIYLWV